MPTLRRWAGRPSGGSGDSGTRAPGSLRHRIGATLRRPRRRSEGPLSKGATGEQTPEPLLVGLPRPQRGVETAPAPPVYRGRAEVTGEGTDPDVRIASQSSKSASARRQNNRAAFLGRIAGCKRDRRPRAEVWRFPSGLPTPGGRRGIRRRTVPRREGRQGPRSRRGGPAPSAAPGRRGPGSRALP